MAARPSNARCVFVERPNGGGEHIRFVYYITYWQKTHTHTPMCQCSLFGFISFIFTTTPAARAHSKPAATTRRRKTHLIRRVDQTARTRRVRTAPRTSSDVRLRSITRMRPRASIYAHRHRPKRSHEIGSEYAHASGISSKPRAHTHRHTVFEVRVVGVGRRRANVCASASSMR